MLLRRGTESKGAIVDDERLMSDDDLGVPEAAAGDVTNDCLILGHWRRCLADAASECEVAIVVDVAHLRS